MDRLAAEVAVVAVHSVVAEAVVAPSVAAEAVVVPSEADHMAEVHMVEVEAM